MYVDGGIERHRNRDRDSARTLSASLQCSTDAVPTYTNTSYIRARLVQKRHHVSPFRDRAFETGVVGIAGEEGQDVGLFGKGGIVAVVIDNGLKSGYAADGFCRTFSEGFVSWCCQGV